MDSTNTEQATAAQADTPAAVAVRHRYQLVLAIEGRIRFLSHLETVDTLLSSLRRAGVRLALSQGMKPKPVIKVAMPRPVAVEAWSDVVEIELAEAVDPDWLALSLSGVLPAGITVLRIDRLEGAYASAASRVLGATYRVVVDGGALTAAELHSATEALRSAASLEVERNSPKQRRMVDVRSFIGDIATVDGEQPAVRFYLRLTEAGSAKPEEVVRGLGALAGRDVPVLRTIRESITLAQPGGGGHVAEPALVGADVPAGPAKPWGAC